MPDAYNTLNVDKRVQFSVAQTPQEYSDVLQLRFLAYRRAKKLADGKTAESMGDELDSRSQIIIGKHEERVICSLRMIMHGPGDRLEQEKFISWPAHLPTTDQVIEVTRACVCPQFQGTEVFVQMLTYFGKLVIEAERKWVVICCSDEMLSFYIRAGAKTLNLAYPHANLNNRVHHVLLANVAAVVDGFGVNPVFWNLVWADVYRYRHEVQVKKLRATARIYFYRLFAPLAHFLLQRKLKAHRNRKSAARSARLRVLLDQRRGFLRRGAS